MKSSKIFKIVRIIIVIAILGIAGAALPQVAHAASPFISITSVKAGEWVTVHASGLPANQLFTARMDKSSTTADNGTTVGQTQSAADGTFDATFVIPASLKSEPSISIRIDNVQGYYAYNWFANKTTASTVTVTPSPTTTPSSTSTLLKLYVEVVAVEKNQRITVSTEGFPASTYFTVKVGPYYTFGKDQQVVKTIYSGNGGTFKFNVDLPANVNDVSLVTIRLDSYSSSTHWVAYNAFTNANKGTVLSDPVSPTPTPTQSGCQILSVSPSQSVATKADFDATWQVKNTSTKAWDQHEIDLRYQSGTKMNKYTGIYDLPATIKPGETVKVTADMIAPSNAGTYTTQFVLVGEHGVLCNLPLTVTVK
jgi:hypothetical protein